MSSQATKNPNPNTGGRKRADNPSGKLNRNVYCTEEEIVTLRSCLTALRNPESAITFNLPDSGQTDAIRDAAFVEGYKAGMDKWVLESDRLPDPGSLVICSCVNMPARYYFGHIVDDCWQLVCDAEDLSEGTRVAHWLDFPDAPTLPSHELAAVVVNRGIPQNDAPGAEPAEAAE